MKTIAFISPTGTLENGAERSILFLMKYLVEQGFHVINIYPKSKRVNQTHYVDTMQRNQIDLVALDVLKWWWPEAPGNSYATSEEIHYFYQLNLAEIKEVLAREEVYLVISNSVNVFLGAIAANELNIPHYWLIHEYPQNEFAYYQTYIPLIKKLSKHLFSVGGELNQTLKEYFQTENIFSFYPYVDMTSKNLSHTVPNEQTIFSIGKVTERKNQFELIQAYEKIKMKHPQIKLTFIGDLEPTYYSKCQQYIEKQRLGDITFLGIKEDPWEIISSQDICVFSSKNETFGLGYVEALMQGVPVIISNNSGFTTAYHLFHFGKMYNLGDMDDLTNQINELLENYHEEKEASEKFKKEMLQLYTVEKMYEEILDKITFEDGVTSYFQWQESISLPGIEQSNWAKQRTKLTIRCKQLIRLLLAKYQK